MTLRLYDNDTSGSLLEREYPKTYSVEKGNIIENIVHFDRSFGTGSYREIFFDHVHIDLSSILNLE